MTTRFRLIVLISRFPKIARQFLKYFVDDQLCQTYPSVCKGVQALDPYTSCRQKNEVGIFRMSDSYWSGLHLSRLKTPASICWASLLPGGAHGAKDADLFSGSSMISRNLTISTFRRKCCFCFGLSELPSGTDRGHVPTVAVNNQRKQELVETFRDSVGFTRRCSSPAREGKCIGLASPATSEMTHERDKWTCSQKYIDAEAAVANIKVQRL